MAVMTRLVSLFAAMASNDRLDRQDVEIDPGEDQRADHEERHRLPDAAILEAPVPVGGEAKAKAPGEKPGHAAQRQAIRHQMQEVADQQPQKGDACAGGDPFLWWQVDVQRVRRLDISRLEQQPAQAKLRAPDNGPRQDQSQQAMEDRAMSRQMLDLFADRSKL